MRHTFFRPSRLGRLLRRLLAAAWIAAVLAVSNTAHGEVEFKVEVIPSMIPVGFSSPLTFTITNKGTEEWQKLTSENTSFELELSAGNGTDDLVPEANVQKINVASNSVTSYWQVTPTKDSKQWTLAPSAGRTVSLKSGGAVKFALDSVVATVPGSAKLTIKAKVLGKPPAGSPYPLSVEKSEPRAEIEKFFALPSVLAKGSQTKLRWKVTFPDPKSPANRVTLNGVDVDPEDSITCKPAIDATYKLEAQPGSVEKTIEVAVKEPRWYSTLSPSDKKLIPTLLFSAPGEPTLYGIFTNEDGADPALWKNENPREPHWLKITAEHLPPRMITSSGVFFKKALYLIGGSAVFNASFSNEVWRLDLTQCRDKDCAWTQLDSPSWQPRQGQTTLAHGGKIWMLGGYDRLSNPLNEIWTFDGSRWENQESQVKPPARGLPAAATTGKDSLVVFGGFDGYQQAPLADLWMDDDGTWQQISLSSPVENIRAVSIIESSIDKQLYLNTAYIEEDESTGTPVFKLGSWILEQDGSSWHFAENSHGSAFGGLNNLAYFSLQTVEANGVIWATSTGASLAWPQKLVGNTALYYFVPPSPQTLSEPRSEDNACSNP